jgi:hypothetical protein
MLFNVGSAAGPQGHDQLRGIQMRMHESIRSIAIRGLRHIALAAMLALTSATMTGRAAAQDASAEPQQNTADSARSLSQPTSVWNAHRVVRVINEGSHVVLGDGSIWEIYLPDRPSVNTWKPGDLLVVRESSVTQGDYDYSLKDGRTRGAVAARLVGETNGRS